MTWEAIDPMFETIWPPQSSMKSRFFASGISAMGPQGTRNQVNGNQYPYDLQWESCVVFEEPKMAARSIASLTVSFGLVSIPVKLFSATEATKAISFNLLHKGCGSRLKQ